MTVLDDGYVDPIGLTPDPTRPGFYTLLGRTLAADRDRPGYFTAARINTFAARVLAAMGTAFLDRAGELLTDVVDGLTEPISITDEAARPTAGGWPGFFDLDTTPDPALIGQATGTAVPGGLSRAQARELVRDRPSWRRGTPGAIIAATQQLLIGKKTVRIDERDGSPWRLTVRVFASQYPSGDLDALRAVIDTQKPVGIVLDVVIDTGSSYAHMSEDHGPTYTSNAAAFPTYDAAKNHEPEDGSTP